MAMPCMLDTSNLAVEDREGVYSAARACLLELEGQVATYSPVFGNEFSQTVGESLSNAERANDAASKMLKEIGAYKGKGESDNGLVMTAHGRWQVVRGLAKPVIRWVVVVFPLVPVTPIKPM